VIFLYFRGFLAELKKTKKTGFWALRGLRIVSYIPERQMKGVVKSLSFN
jgi:hypothetical protein